MIELIVKKEKTINGNMAAEEEEGKKKTINGNRIAKEEEETSQIQIMVAQVKIKCR